MTQAPTIQPRKKRGWIVALVIAIVLIGLVIGAEFVARAVVPGIIAGQVRTGMNLADDQEIDVKVSPDLMLPQVIVGSFGEVDLETRDLTVGELTASHVTAHAKDVAFNGEMSDATVTARISAAQLQALIPSDSVAIDELTLSAGEATAHSGFDLFGQRIPITVSATAGVTDGQLALTPTQATVGNITIGADNIANLPAGVGAGIIRPWPICLASSLPKGVTLQEVTIGEGEVSVSADIIGTIATDAHQQALGTCP